MILCKLKLVCLRPMCRVLKDVNYCSVKQPDLYKPITSSTAEIAHTCTHPHHRCIPELMTLYVLQCIARIVAMAAIQQNQLLFNLDVPAMPINLAAKYPKPEVIVIEKFGPCSGPVITPPKQVSSSFRMQLSWNDCHKQVVQENVFNISKLSSFSDWIIIHVSCSVSWTPRIVHSNVQSALPILVWEK